MSEGLTRADVARLAELARIQLDDTELDHLASELPAILDHVKAVQAAAAEDVEPMSHPQPLSNVFRADVAVAGLTPEQALSGAPEQQDQRFLVPQILGED